MSASAKAGLLTALTKYFTKVKSKLKPLIYNQTSIAGGSAKTYEIKDVFTDYQLYDLRSCRVSVMILDTEAGSPTLNMYINADAILGRAIDATGKVIITNPDSTAVTALVVVDYPSMKL